MSNVRVIHPEPAEHEFVVSGRIIIAAHCQDDALLELKDVMDATFIDWNIEQGA